MEFKLDLPQTAGLQAGEERGQIFDLAILGGGPAGLTAAVYALRKQLSMVLISPDLGGQVLWTSGVENYMGYQYISGPELAGKFSSQAKQFSIKLAENESVIGVAQRPDKSFAVATDNRREIISRALILATGKRSRTLGILGEEQYRGRGVSYCAVCDGPFFKAQPVVIAGGGNSALTAALDMLELKCRVTVVNAAEGWQADPVLMEKVQGRAVLLDAHQMIEIVGDGQKVTGVKIRSRKNSTETALPAAGVFVEVGLLPNTEPFKGFVAFNAQNEIVINCASKTSRPGVYAAGDCTSVPEKQIIIAAGDGAKAALAAYRYVKGIPEEK